MGLFGLLFRLRALWLVLFFIGVAIVFIYKDKYPLKKLFLAIFFCLLIATSIFGTHFFPFMAWDKFPNTYPETETDYQVRVVTENNQELAYDFRSTLGVDGIYEPYLTPKMAKEYSYCKNINVMEHLLTRARVYRDQIENRSVLTFLRFPPHGLVYIWTKRGLRQYGDFTGVRLYEREIHSSSDGTEVTRISEEMLIEYNTSMEHECAPSNLDG